MLETYLDYNIDDEPYFGFVFSHVDYDGPEDRRSGIGSSVQDCKTRSRK